MAFPGPLDPAIFAAVVGGQAASLATVPLAAAGSVSSATGMANGILAVAHRTALGIAGQVKTTAMGVWKQAKDVARQIKDKQTQIYLHSATMARTTAEQAFNRAGQLAVAARSQAHNIIHKGTDMAQKFKTMKFYLKLLKKVWPIFMFFWFGLKYLNTIGIWLFRIFEALIYRIFHIKDCFLWHALEIIGWILYIPMEFFVWLFCMKSWEKQFWRLVDDLDCMVYGIFGYHVFHYSDMILQKCYAVQFPPFPYKAIGMENGDDDFNEKSIIRMIIYWNLPPGPSEIKEGVENIMMILHECGFIVKDIAEVMGEEFAHLFKKSTSKSSDAKDAAGDPNDV